MSGFFLFFSNGHSILETLNDGGKTNNIDEIFGKYILQERL